MLPGFRDGRLNAHCPQCGSSERHRLLWVYLTREGAFGAGRVRLLHIAPEPFFADLFEANENIDYVSGDVDGHGQMTLDITQLPFPDAHFDVVFCSHVLEHVPDDRTALSELRRVTRGWAVIQVPIQGEVTSEEVTNLTAAERLEQFGQEDHVRIYGWDYLDRLRAAGFNTDFRYYAREIPEAERARFCLDPAEPIMIVR